MSLPLVLLLDSLLYVSSLSVAVFAILSVLRRKEGMVLRNKFIFVLFWVLNLHQKVLL